MSECAVCGARLDERVYAHGGCVECVLRAHIAAAEQRAKDAEAKVAELERLLNEAIRVARKRHIELVGERSDLARANALLREWVKVHEDRFLFHDRPRVCGLGSDGLPFAECDIAARTRKHLEGDREMKEEE